MVQNLEQFVNFQTFSYLVSRGFAKKTLMKTARKAGLKSKEPPRKQKYILPTPPLSRRTLGSQLGGSLDYRDQTSHFATYDEELSGKLILHYR